MCSAPRRRLTAVGQYWRAATISTDVLHAPSCLSSHARRRRSLRHRGLGRRRRRGRGRRDSPSSPSSSQRCCMMTRGALGVGFEPSRVLSRCPNGAAGPKAHGHRGSEDIFSCGHALVCLRSGLWTKITGRRECLCRCLSMLAQSKNRLPLRDSRGCAPWSKSSRRQS